MFRNRFSNRSPFNQEITDLIVEGELILIELDFLQKYAENVTKKF